MKETPAGSTDHDAAAALVELAPTAKHKFAAALSVVAKEKDAADE